MISKIRCSIPLKICLVILLVETLLFFVMGSYYYNSFSKEIDRQVAAKLIVPGTLMSQLALNFEAVNDFNAMEELIQEKIADTFIIKKSGDIFYSADSRKIGKNYLDVISTSEKPEFESANPQNRIIAYTTENKQQFLSILSPLAINNNLLGYLYIKIRADRILNKKHNIILIFFYGSLATIILTTVIEAYWVRHLVLPRINKTIAVLNQVKSGDFTSRIPQQSAEDELDLLIHNANDMIAHIEQNTNDLELLNKAGEQLIKDQSFKEISTTCTDFFQHFFTQEELAEVVKLFSLNKDNESTSYLSNSEKEKIAAGEFIFKPKMTITQSSKTHEGVSCLFIPLMVDNLFKKYICFTIYDNNPKFKTDSENFINAFWDLILIALRRTESQLKVITAEKQYRELFTNAVEGFFKSTLDGRLIAANNSLAALAGYNSPQEMIDNIKSVNDYYVDENERQNILLSLQKKNKIQDFEIQLKKKNGTVFPASVSARAVKNREGEIIGIEGGILDISERKKREKADTRRKIIEAENQVKSDLIHDIEEKNKQLTQTLTELKVTQNKLIRSEKMAAIGTMAGGIAHDLNNILSGVTSYPELILFQLPEDSQFRRPIQAIQESGERAVAVVADLLTLARGVAYTKEYASLNDLISKYLQSPEYRQVHSSHKKIHVSTKLAPDLKIILCSPVHIQKIIMNLVNNAMEAIETQGQVTITTENRSISLESDPQGSQPGEYVVLNIKDTGPGIPQKSIKHIFEPFYSKKILGRSGTGLGLSIVYNTVQEHNGTVTVTSDDQGSLFSIYLQASDTGIENISSETVEIAIEKLKGCGDILIVDDEPLLLEIATNMLSILGYTIHTAASGEEAIEFLKHNLVDLVLLDMLMPPGINGYETYKEIIKIHPRLKAIIASGYSSNIHIEKIKKIGAESYLKKPYSMEKLGKAIKEELEKTSS